MTDTERDPEQELEALQDQADSLGDDIDEAREDWERKKADPAVPGAGGDPIAAQSDHAEDQFPGVGDSDSLGSDDPLDTTDPENEDL
jgi:hypothetical protein